MKKGGYIIIDLQSASLVNDLEKALDSNKPVLVYDANNDANFYTLSYDNDLYILNGAKDSFSVDDDGDITPIENKKYQHTLYLADTDNHIFGYINIISDSSTQLDDYKTNAILTANNNQIGLTYDVGATPSHPTEFTIGMIYTRYSNGSYYPYFDAKLITNFAQVKNALYETTNVKPINIAQMLGYNIVKVDIKEIN